MYNVPIILTCARFALGLVGLGRTVGFSKAGVRNTGSPGVVENVMYNGIRLSVLGGIL